MDRFQKNNNHKKQRNDGKRKLKAMEKNQNKKRKSRRLQKLHDEEAK